MSMKASPRPMTTPGVATPETRLRDLLLVALTISTGAVDAICWLGLGKVFSAFMTGNLVFLGTLTGGAAGPPAHRVLTAVAAFALGAALAARFIRSTQDEGEVWPRRVTLVLATNLLVQAAFLGVWWSVDGHPTSGASDVLIALSALAMGAQTVAISSLGVRGVFTTAATATLAFLMGDLSDWSQQGGERVRLAAVVIGLFAGAIVGGSLAIYAVTWAPLFPLAMTALVVTVAARSFQVGRPSQAHETPPRGGHSSQQDLPSFRQPKVKATP